MAKPSTTKIVIEHVRRREQASHHQRRGLQLECGVAVPQPGQTCGEQRGECDLHRIGELNAATPHIRTAEKIDWIFSQPVPPCSSTTVCVKLIEFGKGGQTSPPSVTKLSATRPATVVTAAPIVRHRPPASSAIGISTPNCGL